MPPGLKLITLQANPKPAQRAAYVFSFSYLRMSPRWGLGAWLISYPQLALWAIDISPASLALRIAAELEQTASKCKCLFFSNEKSRRSPGRDRSGMFQRLLSPLGGGASLQGFHRRKMDLCNAVERRSALWRGHHFTGHHLGLARELLHCHRYVLFLIFLFKGIDVLRTRIQYDQLHACHVCSLQ